MAYFPLLPSCSGRLLGLGLLLGSIVFGLPLTASAQTCLQDAYGKNTQCTANDVRIASASNVRDPNTGSAITSCINGSTFSFVADFNVVTTATARENIGMYFATGGQSNALKGQCADNIITPRYKNPNVDYTKFPQAPLLGEPVAPPAPGYEQLDPAPDTCGDISTNDNNQVITVYVQNALCKAGTNGQVALPNCTSWQQPGGTIMCSSPSNAWVPAAIPGSPSKCNCDSTFTIPVAVQNPSVGVAKSCTISSTQQNLTTCNFSGEGGQVTYNVSITNGSNFGNVVIDQVCDDMYGGLYTAAGYTGTSHCTAATGLLSNNCSGLTSVGSSPVTCAFVTTVGENAKVQDTITVYGHGDQSGTAITPGVSNRVTVTSNDAPSSATISKTFASNDQICALVTYNVDVADTTPAGSDETLTMTGLSDSSFGDITTKQGSVSATTCTVSSSSPQTLVVGTDYKCSFQAQFCGQPTTIVATPGKCATSGFCSAGKSNTTSCTADTDCDVSCTGVQHSNTVNATIKGDEGEAPNGTTFTVTPGGLTVSECVNVVAH